MPLHAAIGSDDAQAMAQPRRPSIFDAAEEEGRPAGIDSSHRIAKTRCYQLSGSSLRGQEVETESLAGQVPAYLRLGAAQRLS